MRGGGRGCRVLAAVVAAVIGCAPALSACSASPPRPVPPADLHGARYVVAGGPTDQLVLLCHLAVAVVEAAGAEAAEQCGKLGAADVRSPARSSVDLGWAYVGQADRDLDGEADVPAPFARVAAQDAARGVTWLAPTAFADTDALAVGGPVAAGGMRTVSDLAASPGATICAPPGAVDDPQGLGGVLAVYGLDPARVRPLDPGAVLTETARGRCTAGLVPNTSGRIPALGLVVLVDDRSGFGRGADGTPGPGRGGAAPVLRTPVYAAHPQVAAVLGALTARLTDEVIRELDRRITVEGRDARDVAREWTREAGLTP
ncbi:glycine betaine ABC transporter substrate-binding protein [Actinomycetospora cinnamomea]|uniref:glycine betaine ABC transporter substrate-binding protein n=1 Tax=Actinomycetospora cinnamomea TaxID=663609 RepID=UPI0014029B1E|nr:glycine betaine ABC transporter substrate-binding protein [Actinomycetospora cinnamomea]